jgi:hypothetical protein
MRVCDGRGRHGFSWIVDEPATRTSHVLAAGGRSWLVDPVDWPEAIDRARELGEPAGVLQLLDRHNRDCSILAARLGVPHLVTPDEIPGAPFTCVTVRRTKRWAETALWWAEERTLVVAEAVGTNNFYTAGRATAGVHLLLRLTPPRSLLGSLEPEHLLVGHGAGLHGKDAADGLREALARSRAGLPRALLNMPALGVDAWRRRR